MKKFISKVQNLSKKAAEIQATLERVPPKIEELRQTVTMSAGQLQQMRADVQASVSGLTADNESRLLEAIKEVNDGSDVFEEAGYELARLEMELTPSRKFIVHLNKFQDVTQSTLHLLLTANQSRRTVHSLLASLIRAEAMADKVELSNLTYRTLVVHVGPVPTVRMLWRADETEAEAPAQAVEKPASQPSMGQISNYFEKRSTQAATPVAPVEPAVERETTSPKTPPQSAEPVDWKRNALDRFKKMPDLSKLKR